MMDAKKLKEKLSERAAETLRELEGYIYPLDPQHFNRKRSDPIYKPAVAFILALRAEGVPLKVFTTNDWHSNTRPSVYIDLRGIRLADGSAIWSMNMLRRCVRLDRYGIATALRWYLRNIDPSSCHL